MLRSMLSSNPWLGRFWKSYKNNHAEENGN